MDQRTRELVADVEQTVSFVANDDEIHALVKRLNQALEDEDKPALLQLARRIEEHATYRYAPVVAAAAGLVEHLGG